MKKFMVGIIILMIIVFTSFFIPKKTYPSGDTRVILEHHYKTYLAPMCYNDSGATNFIEDSTLQEANDLQYEPNDACTEEALKEEDDFLFISLLKDLGIVKKKWDEW